MADLPNSVPLSHPLENGTAGQRPLSSGTSCGTEDRAHAQRLRVINKILRDRARDNSGTEGVNPCPTPRDSMGQDGGQDGGQDVGQSAEQEALQERAGILMANGIPQDKADGLALALHVLQAHPQAEAALCWLMDHRNGER